VYETVVDVRPKFGDARHNDVERWRLVHRHGLLQERRNVELVVAAGVERITVREHVASRR
jgi:hypothetical protein